MIDFMQAVKWMKEGKKVRGVSWTKSRYWYLDGEKIVWDDGDVISGYLHQIDTDWEIYEEKDEWKLSDEIKKWVDKQKYFTEDMQDELFEILKENNQKVKEDIKKSLVAEYQNMVAKSPDYDKIIEIIDKRAGDL